VSYGVLRKNFVWGSIWKRLSVIHDDFDAREPSRHIFEHRHLMRQDLEI